MANEKAPNAQSLRADIDAELEKLKLDQGTDEWIGILLDRLTDYAEDLESRVPRPTAPPLPNVDGVVLGATLELDPAELFPGYEPKRPPADDGTYRVVDPGGRGKPWVIERTERKPP